MLFQKVHEDGKAASSILGCLFSQYPTLMVPLLSADHDYDDLFNIL